MKDLRSALQQLDPKNDAHWTGDGLPKLDSDVLAKQFSRNQVTREAPLFNRTNLSFQLPPDEDGDDQVDGPPGEEASTVFGMESSEFGGAAPLQEAEKTDERFSNKEVETALSDAAVSAEAAVAEAHAAADKSKKALEQALKAKDMIAQAQEKPYDPHASQRAVYDFLRSVQPHGTGNTAGAVPKQSPLDTAMGRRKTGRADQRPIIPLRPIK